MIDVACALITLQTGEILVTQRSSAMSLPLKWEFPGGKVEPGESAEQCILREVKEELGIDIAVLRKMKAHAYDNGRLQIRLIPFRCEMLRGEIVLTEHARYLWLKREELSALDWAGADLPVLEDYLNDSL